MSVRTVVTACLLPLAACSLALLGTGSAAAATPAQLLPATEWTVAVGVQGSPVVATQSLANLRGVELIAIESPTGTIELENFRTKAPSGLRVEDLAGEPLTVTITKVQPNGSRIAVDHGHLDPDSTLVFAPDGR